MPTIKSPQHDPNRPGERRRLSAGQRNALWLSLLALPVIAGHAHARARPSGAAESPSLPEIRTHATNKVPACVTPDRLNAFLDERNPKLDPKFHGIAAHYKRYGETYEVRWDFAFFQMLLETNHLSFMRGPGRPGDVKPRQNNFAGIGATGGGVPGESYPDVATGVLVQIQHLVAYSGERVENAASPRTRENQDEIIKRSKRIGRPLTFRDLVNRWAMDRSYARSIESIAEAYRSRYCTGPEPPTVIEAARPLPGKAADTSAAGPRPRLAGSSQPERTTLVGVPSRGVPAAPVSAVRPDDENRTAAPATTAGSAGRPGPASTRGECKVWSASFGGRKVLLVRAHDARAVNYTALEVVDGFETSMLQTFVATHAPGGKAVAEFTSQKDAIEHAFTLCKGNTGAEAVDGARPSSG